MKSINSPNRYIPARLAAMLFSFVSVFLILMATACSCIRWRYRRMPRNHLGKWVWGCPRIWHYHWSQQWNHATPKLFEPGCKWAFLWAAGIDTKDFSYEWLKPVQKMISAKKSPPMVSFFLSDLKLGLIAMLVCSAWACSGDLGQSTERRNILITGWKVLELLNFQNHAQTHLFIKKMLQYFFSFEKMWLLT